MSQFLTLSRRALDRLSVVRRTVVFKSVIERTATSSRWMVMSIRKASSNPKHTLPPRIKYELRGVEKFSNKKLTWWDWWPTDTGRQAARSVALLAGSTIVGICWMTELIATSFVQKCYTEDKEGVESVRFVEWLGEGVDTDKVPPSPELVRLYSRLWKRADLDEVQHEKIEVFTSALLDPVVIGCTHSKSGASVGLPRHMMWTKEDDIDLQDIYIKPYWNPFFKGYRIPADIDPDQLHQLKQTFLLSENAREFIVSKCMNEANLYTPWFRTFLPGFLSAVHYVMGRKLNNQMNLFQQPRYVRMGVQGLWGFCVTAVAIALLNQLQHFQESISREMVIRSTREAMGAIEYYNKSIERNKLLAKILGPESEYYFTEDGNVVCSPFVYPEVVDLNKHLENSNYLLNKYKDIERRRAEIAEQRTQSEQ